MDINQVNVIFSGELHDYDYGAHDFYHPDKLMGEVNIRIKITEIITTFTFNFNGVEKKNLFEFVRAVHDNLPYSLKLVNNAEINTSDGSVIFVIENANSSTMLSSKNITSIPNKYFLVAFMEFLNLNNLQLL